MNCPEDEDLLPPYVHQQPSQSNAQASQSNAQPSQSNAQPSQSNGQPSQADEPNFEKGEILARLGSLMASIMVFIMDIGGYRYDPYFFTPALLAMQDSEQHYKEFLQFFAKDFTIEEHAKDFEFCNRENKVQFAQRFFNHIAALQNVPGNIRALAAQFANGFRVRHTGCDINGFFKPCPLYTFVRTASLFIIVETEVFGVDMTKLELIIDFLLRDFDPKAYDIEDKANVHEMVTVLAQGFGANNTQMVLPDGTTGRMRSRELLQLLAEHEAVPENIKQAAKDILPCF